MDDTGTKMEKRLSKLAEGKTPIVTVKREQWDEILPGVWVKFLTASMHDAQFALRGCGEFDKATPDSL
jgi:hypothetical protein